MLSMSPSKRRDTDMMKLMMSDFEVHIPDESSMHDFLVAFPGPEDTPYQGGIWKVHVTLPKEYPFKSPSIGFENRMFHPNVDEMSGSVCLDVINQTWSPMFDLVNIFKLFIPQLLSYPNPTDPLNGEAAALLMRDPEAYANRIKECVRLHASDPVHLDGTPVVQPPPPSTSTPSTPLARNDGGGSGHGAAGTGGGAVAASNSSAVVASTGALGTGAGASSEAGRPADEDSDKPTESSTTASTSRSASIGEGSSSACPVGSSSREGDVAAASNSDMDNMVVADDDGDDVRNKVGEPDEHMKRRKSSSADTNDGAGSSSASEYFEMEMDETASDVSALSDVEA
ncbi:unnamed protein product [Sphacelaria rigidula]